MTDELAPIHLPPRLPLPKPNPLRFLIDHNPCFILSAFLMFLGCYLLNCAMDAHAADIAKSLALLATINVYEFALIALAFALLPKPCSRGRDGVLLLFVQLLFLADGPFLIAQLLQVPSHWSTPIAIILSTLALFKAVLVFNVARIPIRPRTYGFLALNLLLIYALPILLARISTAGELPPHTLYLVWWIVGLLPALSDLLARFDPLKNPLTPRQQFLRRSTLIIPWLLLIAHLAFFHWIYRADFSAADLSPLLLGLAVASRRINPTLFLPKNQLRSVRLTLPLLALLLTALGTPDVRLSIPFTTLAITPTLLTAAAVLITYGYLRSLPAALAALSANLLMLVGRIFLTNILTLLDWLLTHARNLAARTLEILQHLLPTTPTAWGILAIIAAFLLLAIGAIFSLPPPPRRKPSNLTPGVHASPCLTGQAIAIEEA